MKPLLSRTLTQRRVCGTERATSAAIRSIEGHAFPFPPANCSRRAKTSFSDGSSSGLLRTSDGTSAPSNRLNGLNTSPTLHPRLARRSWREAGEAGSLSWRLLRFSDTLGVVTVDARTASPKPFLLKAPLRTVPSVFRGPPKPVCQNLAKSVPVVRF
jgi:hypothetical protein